MIGGGGTSNSFDLHRTTRSRSVDLEEEEQVFPSSAFPTDSLHPPPAPPSGRSESFETPLNREPLNRERGGSAPARKQRSAFAHSRSSTLAVGSSETLMETEVEEEGGGGGGDDTSDDTLAFLHAGFLTQGGRGEPKIRVMTLAESMGLSIYQQQLLIQNWPKIYAAGLTRLGMDVFQELFNREPVSKEMIQKAQVCESFSGKKNGDIMRDHCRLLGELFDLAIRSLDEPCTHVLALCHDYGHHHFNLRTRGFTSSVWDSLSDILLERVRKNDAVRKSRELGKAWALIISFLVDRMKQGQASTKTCKSAASS